MGTLLLPSSRLGPPLTAGCRPLIPSIIDTRAPAADNIKMKVLNYRILLTKEPEGGYTVTVPSLPGCATYGDTLEQAMAMAREAVELYLESLRQHGDEIPTDDSTLEYTLTVHDGA